MPVEVGEGPGVAPGLLRRLHHLERRPPGALDQRIDGRRSGASSESRHSQAHGSATSRSPITHPNPPVGTSISVSPSLTANCSGSGIPSEPGAPKASSPRASR